MSRYRLPLELELHILDLALPPLLMPTVESRVEFCLAVSLLHRSFTTWGQQHLHEQFVYTYRHREGELQRIEQRKGDAAATEENWRPTYVLLNLQALDEMQPFSKCRSCHTPIPVKGNADDRQRSPDVAYYTHGDECICLSEPLTAWLRGVSRLGIRLPHTVLDLDDGLGPEVFEVDDSACCSQWPAPMLNPPTLERTLVVHHFDVEEWASSCATLRTLVLVSSTYSFWDLPGFSEALLNLVNFVSHLSTDYFSRTALDAFSSNLRNAFFILNDDCELEDDDEGPRTAPFAKPAKLELCSLVKLRSHSTSPSDSEEADFERFCAPLVEAFTQEGAEFRFKVSDRTADEELADVMSAVGL